MENNKSNLPVAGKIKRRVSPFSLMISGSILIACVLVWVSMQLYKSSGAAQLDLSRPSYQDVREEAEKNTQKVKSTDSFSAIGKLDKAAFEEFDEGYKAQRDAVKESEDVFGSAPLEDAALEISVE